MSEFFHTGRFFQQDAERTRTEQLERQKQEQRYLGSATRLPGMRLYEFIIRPENVGRLVPRPHWK